MKNRSFSSRQDSTILITDKKPLAAQSVTQFPRDLIKIL